MGDTLIALVATRWRRWLAARGISGRTARHRSRLRVEGLEQRALLASITEFPIPSGSGSANAIVAGPDGNLWFTENDAVSNSIGQDDPQRPGHRVQASHAGREPVRDHGRAGRRPLVHRAIREQYRRDHHRRTDYRIADRGRQPFRTANRRDHGRAGRQPLVRREPRPRDRRDDPNRARHRVSAPGLVIPHEHHHGARRQSLVHGSGHRLGRHDHDRRANHRVQAPLDHRRPGRYRVRPDRRRPLDHRGIRRQDRRGLDFGPGAQPVPRPRNLPPTQRADDGAGRHDLVRREGEPEHRRPRHRHGPDHPVPHPGEQRLDSRDRAGARRQPLVHGSGDQEYR